MPRRELELNAAIAWGDAPFAFYARPDVERAMMVAHFRITGLRRSMETTIAREVSEKQSKADGGTSASADHRQFFGE